jgi:AraC-like DNA-binding protein
MYHEKVIFVHGVPLSMEGWNVGSYHLHAHRDVIEILLVLKGKATVTISCETFEMDEGDYVVIREQDSHMFTAADSGCELVSLYLNMTEYVKKIPYLYYVIFGCESFDLAKYRNETTKIRRMIASVLINLLQGDESSVSEALKGAENLLWLLVNDYDMVKYYNRKWDAPFIKVEKYYKIMGYIFDFYYMKNIQEYIANREFYSKSYITHLFREVGATSFKDMLDYVRIFKSEEFLLNTNHSINDISDQCGFSDVKYYTSNFKKWYMCTPSEYRKRALNEINRKNIFQQLSPLDIQDRMKRMLHEDQEDSRYRAAVNPLSLKAFGDVKQTFLPENGELDFSSNQTGNFTGEPMGEKHYLPIRIKNEMLSWTKEQMLKTIKSYENSYCQPVLIVEWNEIPEESFRTLLQEFLESYHSSPDSERTIYVMYSNINEYKNVSDFVNEFKNAYCDLVMHAILLKS